jgi:hypothetical protein
MQIRFFLLPFTKSNDLPAKLYKGCLKVAGLFFSKKKWPRRFVSCFKTEMRTIVDRSYQPKRNRICNK